MAGSSRSGTSWKAGYTSYKAHDRCAKNKARKIAKHKAKHPNDKGVDGAKLAYTRKESGNKGGWVTGRTFAEMSAYLGISKDNDHHSVSRSRAVQKRIAEHMAFDKASRNEQVYVRPSKQTSKKKAS